MGVPHSKDTSLLLRSEAGQKLSGHTINYGFAPNDKEQRMSYTGQVREGRMHGTGRLDYHNGDYYDGQWHQGLKHGRGVLCLSDNAHAHAHHNNKHIASCKGTWVKGKLEGPGIVITFSDRDEMGRESFVCDYRKGSPHGIGKVTWKDGVTFGGLWEDGRRFVLRELPEGVPYTEGLRRMEESDERENFGVGSMDVRRERSAIKRGDVFDAFRV
eukprot:TRINITY_DN4523_c0_g1_i1.p1 TRINITY_DN4523_c0_g1~~TRINITY_DN4523_c0_g1_i1.p1  ORF type:complete len:214 (-),score=28.57 TRINITY_DN4523_c0_g1_i1:198-839(-)